MNARHRLLLIAFACLVAAFEASLAAAQGSARATLAGAPITAANASNLVLSQSLDMAGSFPEDLDFSADGGAILCGDMAGGLVSWDLASGRRIELVPPSPLFRMDANGKPPYWGTPALSARLGLVVAADGKGDVTLRDGAGKAIFGFSFGAVVFSAAISPDGRLLALGGAGKRIAVLDLERRAPVAELAGEGEYVSVLRFSADGSILLAGIERPGNVMRIWDTSTWKEIAAFRHVEERFDYHDLLFAPGERQAIIIAGTRNAIEVFEPASGRITMTLAGHRAAPYRIALSPDGTLLASASDDMTVRVWDLATGKQLAALRCPAEAYTLAFSPDGSRLACGVLGIGIRVWEAAKN